MTRADSATAHDRFPGLDIAAMASRWDHATRAVVLSRLRAPGALRFHDDQEAATVRAMVGLLLDLDGPVLDQVVGMLDARLADGHTDGWRHEDMPEDSQAWRESLRGLDSDAIARHGRRFRDCSAAQQENIVRDLQRRGSVSWYGRDASHVWSLWTRYACAAYYAHPLAWSEIGFPGPAYPRGYANLGIDALDHHEVADALPNGDPRSVPHQ